MGITLLRREDYKSHEFNSDKHKEKGNVISRNPGKATNITVHETPTVKVSKFRYLGNRIYQIYMI